MNKTYFSKKFMISMSGLGWIRFFLMLVLIVAGGFSCSQAHYCDGLGCERDVSRHMPSVQVGQTLEFLLASEGDPTETKSLAGKDYYLNSYYYKETNTTFIVNTETGYICDTRMGKHIGNCFPDAEQKGLNK